MPTLVWKLLRQHISIGQLAGFFLANLFGMIIFAVLLCLMVNSSMNIMTWQKLSQKPISMQVNT